MKSKIAVAVVAVCVGLASCGGDDSGSGDGLSGAVNEALTASMSGEDAPFEVTDENVSCLTTKLLDDEETSTALQAAYDDGKTGEDLLGAVDENTEMETKATLMTFQCMTVEQIVDTLSAELGGESQLTDDQRSCLTTEFEKLSSDELANDFAAIAGVVEDQEAADQLMEILTTCTESSM